MSVENYHNRLPLGVNGVMGEKLQPAPPEVLEDFETVRQAFIETFSGTPAYADMEAIETYFNKEDLSHFPLVTVPFTKEASIEARHIAEQARFPQKFLTTKFDENRDFSVFWASGLGWSIPAYRLNFQFDTGSVTSAELGEDVARRYATGLAAHELAHSIFHREPQVAVTVDDSREIDHIYEYYPLSGKHYLKYAKSQDAPEYLPSWIEEAIAVYVDGQVAKPEIPRGTGTVLECEEWGSDVFWLNEHYLVRSPRYPDAPGSIVGAVAGQALESLNVKNPGTIQKIFDIARGKGDADQFRAELRAVVGVELCGLMFDRQPYAIWSDIYQRIGALPRNRSKS